MPAPNTNATEPIVVWHEQTVSRGERETLNGHRGCVVWFTGLSGSGKSTIANFVDRQLHRMGVRSYVLDGDNVRHGLNAAPQLLVPGYGDSFATRFGLGFGKDDRTENIRRIGEVAKLFCDAGIVTLTAFVSPYRADRNRVRAILPPEDFIEVFVDAPLEACESRDPKGLYKQARAGQLAGFTGIDDPYEPPLAAELALKSAEQTVVALADEVINYLRRVSKVPGSAS